MYKKLNLKDMVANDDTVSLDYYQRGQFHFTHTKTGLRFAVDTAEFGEGKVLAVDKAMFYMRWLRPVVEDYNSRAMLGDADEIR